MALGLLLWVAWISLLLDSSVFTEAQGNKYRQTHDRLNLVDASDFLDSLDLDEGQGEPLSDKLSKVVNKEYKKSPVAQPLKLFSVNQNMAAPHADVDRLVNGASRKWESNVFEPITFPLQSGSQMVDQTMPVYESQSEHSAVYEGGKPAHPSFEVLTGIDMPQPKPVQSPHWAVSPPAFESWQPVFNEGVDEPVFYQQQVDSTNAAGPEFPDNYPLYYQGSNMVEFSPDNLAPQRKPSRKYQPAIPKPQSESWHTPEWSGQDNEIAGSFNFAIPNWLGFPHSDAWLPNSYVSRGYQPDSSLSYTNYLTPRVGAPFQKAPELPRPLPPRKSFIVQSKNGYQRRRLLKSKTTYTPDYKLPKAKYGKSVNVLRGAVQNRIPSVKV